MPAEETRQRHPVDDNRAAHDCLPGRHRPLPVRPRDVIASAQVLAEGRRARPTGGEREETTARAQGAPGPDESRPIGSEEKESLSLSLSLTLAPLASWRFLPRLVCASR